MSFTLVNSGVNSNNGSGGTLAIAVTGVHVGDLVYVTASCSGVAGITSVSDGTTTLTPRTELHTGNSGNSLRRFYLLASVASGTLTYTVTYSGTPTSRSITVYVFTPSSAASLDVGTGQETIATPAGDSGAVTTTGTDELCFGSQVNENQSASSVEKINGVAATAVINSGTNHTLWYTKPVATFTGDATETIGSSTRTLTTIDAFKTSGGGATRGLFRPPSVTGLGGGGSFFADPLQACERMAA